MAECGGPFAEQDAGLVPSGREAYCVKKCAAGFRMELSGKKPVCIGLKADATYTPPKPAYQPPKPNPSRQAPPGA